MIKRGIGAPSHEDREEAITPPQWDTKAASARVLPLLLYGVSVGKRRISLPDEDHDDTRDAETDEVVVVAGAQGGVQLAEELGLGAWSRHLISPVMRQWSETMLFALPPAMVPMWKLRPFSTSLWGSAAMADAATAFFFPGEDFSRLVVRDQLIEGKTTYVLPHPSPLNAKWFKDHPEFEAERMPVVRAAVQSAPFARADCGGCGAGTSAKQIGTILR